MPSEFMDQCGLTVDGMDDFHYLACAMQAYQRLRNED